MGPEPKPPPPKPDGEEAQTESSPRVVSRKALIAAYAFPIALAVSILANLVGVFYFRSLAIQANPLAPQEISLGTYSFVAEEHEPGQVTQAQFALHIELIRQAAEPARRLLEVRRQKVRQNLEELLRTAHGGDFSDPTLRQLKGQFQKRINETLEIHAVADVIVTDLRLERSPPRTAIGQTGGKNVPWVEPTAG